MSESTLEALGGGAPPAAQFGHDALIACDNLVRIFQSGSVEVQALQGLDLLVDEGEMVAVVGASGSGKSTLLAVLSGMDAPTAGRVRVGRWDLMAMHARDRVHHPPCRRERRSMLCLRCQEPGISEAGASFDQPGGDDAEGEQRVSEYQRHYSRRRGRPWQQPWRWAGRWMRPVRTKPPWR